MTVQVDAGTLLPGRGAPVRPGTVVFDDTGILYAGPTDRVPATQDAERVNVATVMPGLWDCHAHFFGFPPGRVAIGETLATQTPQVGILRAADHARRALVNGITSVREVGGYGVLLSRAVEEGAVTGPSIYGAGSPLSMTGGHGDVHELPVTQAIDLFERHFGAPGLADGTDECRRAVRRQLRLGAKVIKVCASGGVMSQVDHPIHQQFTLDELRAIVEEAGRADRVVAAHCHGKPGIMAAVEAGVRTVEHGTYVDEEAASAMVESDVVLVPTRFIVEHLVGMGDSPTVPDYAREKIRAIADQHAEALATAIAAGVRVAMGTDIWGADVWGRNAEELTHLVAAGLTPLEAIEAATATGPLTLGPQAPRSGVLAEGHDADVLAVDGDPTEDVSVLADPERIAGVWRGGTRVR